MMTPTHAASPATSTPTRTRFGAARSLVTLLALLSVGVAILLTGCGGSGSAAAVDTTTVTAQADPGTLSTGIVDTWSEAMQALVALLQDKPEISAVSSQVQDLKETTIQTLVALGRQRETLSDADKARSDSLVWSALQDLADQLWYSSFNTLWSYYAGLDLELGNVISSFNVLTQYADFTLLKEQLPDEATRLGIE